MSDVAVLERVRVVLSHTSHPGNIGAAARAMRTMGLSHLYLVKPKHFPHVDARALAAGALDILNAAVVCETLEEALSGTVLAVAATARNRDLSHEVVDCRTASLRLVSETRRGDVALVFGTERTGLTVAEVSKCGLIATIPSNATYSSLNVAQAVQVFAYELRIASETPDNEPAVEPVNLATHEEVEHFYEHLERTLYSTGFLNPAQPGRLMQRMRRLFARSRLEKEEVNILRGILSAMQDKAQ
jgi:tRNA/rRNA methyltransferase